MFESFGHLNSDSQGNLWFDDSHKVPQGTTFVDLGATLDTASGIVTILLSFQTFHLGVFMPGERLKLIYSFSFDLQHALIGGIAGGQLTAKFSDPFHLSTNSALGTLTFEPVSTAVPEPSTVLLFGSGLVLIGASRRRKSRM